MFYISVTLNLMSGNICLSCGCLAYLLKVTYKSQLIVTQFKSEAPIPGKASIAETYCCLPRAVVF